MAARNTGEHAPLLGAGQSANLAAEAIGKHIDNQIQQTVYWEPHGGQSPSRLDESDFVTVTEDRDLKRGLHQRHVSLIAIAGAIVREVPSLQLRG